MAAAAPPPVVDERWERLPTSAPRVAIRSLGVFAVQRGDEAILYAAVWQAVFGVAEVVGEPENDPDHDRWAWRFPIRPLVVVPDLHDAPPAEEAGIFPQSLWRHSYIRLSDEQFDRARELIEAVGSSA